MAGAPGLKHPLGGCILLTAAVRITTMYIRILLALTSSLALTAGAPPTADVSIRQIKFTTEDQLTRVVIETAGKLPYHAARLSAPDRIYFDLKGVSATTGPRVIPVGGKLLRQIRVSPKEAGVTRIVLDVEPGVEYSVLRLSDPDRLVIDVRAAGSAAPTPAAAAVHAPEPAVPEANPDVVVSEPRAPNRPPLPAPPTPAPEPAAPTPTPAPMAAPEPAAPTPTPAPVAAPEPPAPAPVASPEPAASVPAPAPAATPAPEPMPAPAAAADAAGPNIVEEIVAKVNNEIVTRGEMDKFRRMVEGEIAHQGLNAVRAQEALKQAERDLLRDRIDQLLMVAKAKELDLKVDQELSKQIATLQLKSGITDTDKFHEWVREQSGMSFEDYKEQAKDNLLTQDVVRREVGGRLTISKAEEQKYYEDHKNEFVREEQVWLQEILISTRDKDEKGVAAAEKKAQDLVNRARKGENFSTLARDNSDAETAEGGGNLPAFKRGLLKKEIEDVVFQQTKGFVMDPIRQANGFLILRLVQHDAAGLQPFDAVENEIMDRMYQPKMQPALRAYLTKLRQEAFLQIKAGYVDSGAAPGKDTSWQAVQKLKPQTVTKEEVAMRTRRKRLLFMLPVPGTEKRVGLSSSSPSTIPTPGK